MDLPAFVAIILILGTVYWKILSPPSNFPKNIPTIPFYVAFLPAVTGWDQERIFNIFYRKKLEEYGAVKFYFASRWNILVSKPEYVLQYFKRNDIFEKSGNHFKIPHAVSSHYLGDNVISAGNKDWKLYRSVVTSSITQPDVRPLKPNIETLLERITEAVLQNEKVSVSELLQKFTLACIGDCVIGCDLKSSDEGQTIHEKVIFLKRQIFHPLYMTFPFLDRLPIPSRQRARKEVDNFKQFYSQKIVLSSSSHNSKRLGPRLAHSFANGELTEKQFQDNAMIAMIAGHENPQMLLMSILYMLAKFPNYQTTLRNELALYEDATKESCPFVNAIVFETLRMYPPLGQLVNRVSTKNTTIGRNIIVPKGVYVAYNSFMTQRDRGVWKDADDFLPERWGTSGSEIADNYALWKSRCKLTCFSGGSRTCLGEKFALKETRLTIIGIVENFTFTLHPEWKERLTPAGPVWPVQLALKMKRLP